MCYAKVDGGYRCIPSARLLNAYKGDPKDTYAPRKVNGAFWMNPFIEIPHLMEIQQEAESLRTEIFMIDDDKKLETEVSHLGNMISRYADSQVEDFNRRLKNAQHLGFKYQEATRDFTISSNELIKLREKAINANLELGYESRHRLNEVLEKISPSGTPLGVNIPDDKNIGIEYREHFKDALRDASTIYPSSWNHALDDNIKLTYVYDEDNEDSSFNRNNNEIKIHPGDYGFASYSSLNNARAARSENEFAYVTRVDMVHELAHKFEFIQPDIVRVSRSFLKRRALPGQHVHFDGYGEVKDHFTWSYAGKLWGNRHTEVFSVGMESTLLGTQGSFIGLALPTKENQRLLRIHRPDIEHRNLTLGILAAIHMPFNNDTGYEDLQNTKRKKAKTMFGEVDPFHFE